MKIYLLAMGGCSLLYYLLICSYTGKWDSTFARFWLISGLLHLILGCVPMTRHIQTGLGCLFAAGWLVFLAVIVQICRAMSGREEHDRGYLIILGAQVRGRRITNSLKRRLDAALPVLLRNPQLKVIVSGGQGKGEDISEACAMAEYLIGRGIEADRILREEKSTSTRENLRFSAKLAEDLTVPVGIVTNNFHIYRALWMGRQEGYRKLYGIPAGTNAVLFLNYMVREACALLAAVLRAGLSAVLPAGFKKSG